MLELWRAGGSNTGASADIARAVEAEGWDGQMFMDSQSIGMDPYVLMAVWATATQRLKLSTGVTNPLTRNLAVTASAISSVQVVSGGRAVLGIGRGDSALAYLGHAPVGTGAFENALEDLQKLLGGEAIDLQASSVEAMSLGDRPGATRLNWLSERWGLPEAMPKVPLDVAATGPKVIAMAARIAEQVTFSVGASAERMGWALDLARAEAGLGGAGASYGAQVVVACHTDDEAAMAMAIQSCAPLARFQVIQGPAAGPQDEADAQNFAAIRKGYDMNKHGGIAEAKLKLGQSLTPDFVRRFAIVGPPDHCTARLLELAACGLSRFVIVGPGFYPESWGEARNLFAREVLPALHAATG